MDSCCRCRSASWRRIVYSYTESRPAKGALQYFECVADDVKPGKLTSFPQAVKLKKGETVFFSFIIYKSRKQRDTVNGKVMKDPRIAKYMDPKTMPFDGKRMFWGGFKGFVEY